MNPFEHVSLAPLTTLRIGGEARFLITVHTEQDIDEAIEFARQRSAPLVVIGEGSNLLIPDAGFEGVVLRCAVRGITFADEGDTVLVTAGAGELWEDLIDAVAKRGLFGIENLAGIPGSVGGAAVQNIGAYGAEFSETFVSADTIDRATGARRSIGASEASFGYRTSVFKKDRSHLITRVVLRLRHAGPPNLSYADLARAKEGGIPLATSEDVVRAVRAIRARKFPDPSHEGSAGSFFKNPVITPEAAATLVARYPGLPTFPQPDGSVKVSLAWILDHVLSLKGFTQGHVRLYEKQPLVIVAEQGAKASEVDAIAQLVMERVQKETGIILEREVETLGIA